eukprot:g53314.t1
MLMRHLLSALFCVVGAKADQSVEDTKHDPSFNQPIYWKHWKSKPTILDSNVPERKQKINKQYKIAESFPGFQLIPNSQGSFSLSSLDKDAVPRWRKVDDTEILIEGTSDTTYIILEFSELPDTFTFRISSVAGAQTNALGEQTLTELDVQAQLNSWPISTRPAVGSTLRLILDSVQPFTLQSIVMGSLAKTAAWIPSVDYVGKQDTKETICSNNQDTFSFMEANAKCWPTNSVPYLNSRAVARLLVRGSTVCTGFLISPLGLLLTNHHCIGSAEDALRTTFEFGAEAPDCGARNGQLFFTGDIVRGAKFLGSDSQLDYSLVALHETWPVQRYGWMGLDFDPGSVWEGLPIYMPQHPLGMAKVIGWYDASLRGQLTESVLTSVTLDPCTGATGTTELGYMLDTDVGSSGSPVVSRITNKVIGLHHCGGCPNQAVRTSYLSFVLAPTLAGQCVQQRDCSPMEVCLWQRLGDVGRCVASNQNFLNSQSDPRMGLIPTASMATDFYSRGPQTRGNQNTYLNNNRNYNPSTALGGYFSDVSRFSASSPTGGYMNSVYSYQSGGFQQKGFSNSPSQWGGNRYYYGR